MYNLKMMDSLFIDISLRGFKIIANNNNKLTATFER